VKARRRGHHVRVDFHAVEADLLESLFDEIGALLAEPDADDPVVKRLYPAGYTDDAEAAAEFRELVAGSLRTERLARLDACRRDLPPDGGRIELDAAAVDRWIRVLNDVRLGLGTRLGVTEDAELDPLDEAVNVYHWLSGVQELLVSRLMS
jgi:hypothetical protein